MKSKFCALLVLGLAMGPLAASAATTTLNFDSLGNCSGGGGVAFSFSAPTACYSMAAPSSSPAIAFTRPLTGSPNPITVRADFLSAVNFVSVDLGDFNADPDTIFLSIFDSADNSLGTTSFFRLGSSYAMDTLSLSAANISYALFGTSADDLGGIYADNFSFGTTTPVPLPAAAWLLLSGLAGLGVLGRRKAA